MAETSVRTGFSAREIGFGLLPSEPAMLVALEPLQFGNCGPAGN